MKPYYIERRYVLKILSSQLKSDLMNGSDWIYQDDADPTREASEFVVRRRKAAIYNLIKEFERKGAKFD